LWSNKIRKEVFHFDRQKKGEKEKNFFFFFFFSVKLLFGANVGLSLHFLLQCCFNLRTISGYV